MTKSTITRVWIAGLALFAGGALLAIVAVFLMLAYGGTLTQVANTNNYDFVPNTNGFFWFTVAMIVSGGVTGLIGSIVQFVAWVGGLVNSYALTEKTWFLVLLLGGLASFFLAPIGFAAMIAYVIAAPDGSTFRLPYASMPAAPLAPTT